MVLGFTAKDNLVCRAALDSVSFAGVTFDCLALDPRLGGEPLPLVLVLSFRLDDLPMVDVRRVAVAEVRSVSA